MSANIGFTGMEIFSNRLATFEDSHPSKRRESEGAEFIADAWPLARPTPEQLADAGFYHAPTTLSPDNTICYLCERALDGWEEDDDPLAEHLKHSQDCGWAILMDIARGSSNPAAIEDPTSERITEARRSTFRGWPHDGKRRWICKSEKMVEAGWYYCPMEESEDFVSCAYCKLSLDGWEPKDDPFDEHFRRSSDCSFFHFATKNTGRSRGTKRQRSSKTSRISTQSGSSLASDTSDSSPPPPTTTTAASKGRGKKRQRSSRTAHIFAQPESPQASDFSDYSPPPMFQSHDTRRQSPLMKTSDIFTQSRYPLPSDDVNDNSAQVTAESYDTERQDLPQTSRISPEPRPPTIVSEENEKEPRSMGSAEPAIKPLWKEADIDEVFVHDARNSENENLQNIFMDVKGELTTPEKKMTAEQWIRWNASRAEEKLANECERLVNIFEREGSRAVRALEDIEVID